MWVHCAHMRAGLTRWCACVCVCVWGGWHNDQPALRWINLASSEPRHVLHRCRCVLVEQKAMSAAEFRRVATEEAERLVGRKVCARIPVFNCGVGCVCVAVAVAVCVRRGSWGARCVLVLPAGDVRELWPFWWLHCVSVIVIHAFRPSGHHRCDTD